MKQPPLLKVLPNPFFALDADGMPAGIVRYDPEVGRKGVVEFVGCQVTKEVIPNKDLPGNQDRHSRERRRTTKIAWSQTPVEIPATAMHVGYVRCGALIPVDKASARACLVWPMEPAAALSAARDAAVKEWRLSHDEDPPIEDWDAAVGLAKIPAAPAAPVEPELLAAPFGRPEVK